VSGDGSQDERSFNDGPKLCKRFHERDATTRRTTQKKAIATKEFGRDMSDGHRAPDAHFSDDH
jgi:hypothetical protein